MPGCGLLAPCWLLEAHSGTDTVCTERPSGAQLVALAQRQGWPLPLRPSHRKRSTYMNGRAPLAPGLRLHTMPLVRGADM